MTINRDTSGAIISIDTLQGNQPVFTNNADEIRAYQTAQHTTPTAAGTLRDAPGRRIEVGTLSGSELGDIVIGTGTAATNVWSWNDSDFTTLVAAGPPAAATRLSGGRRVTTLGIMSNWQSMLATATVAGLSGVFENALRAGRATIEGTPAGTAVSVTDAEARALGQAVVSRLSSFMISAGFGNVPLFDTMVMLLQIITALRASGTPGRRDEVHRFFSNVSEGYINGCATTLQTTFLAALQQLLSGIRPGYTANDSAAADLGATAGNRVWAIAQAAADFARLSHLDLLLLLQSSIQATRAGGGANQTEVDRVFAIVEEQFRFAARGAAPGAIDFARSRTVTTTDTIIRTLVTGFDAFDLSGGGGAPQPENGILRALQLWRLTALL